MALLVLAHGVGLIALALLTHRIAPEIARMTLITGLAGGGLCALLGVRGLFGHRRRVGAALTLIPVSIVLITQAVSGWMEQGGDKAENPLAPALMTVMLVASVGVLAYVLHAGENAPRENASTPHPKSK